MKRSIDCGSRLDAGTQHLESDAAAQLEILCAVDLARGALAEITRDPVARRDDLAGEKIGAWRRLAHVHSCRLTLERL